MTPTAALIIACIVTAVVSIAGGAIPLLGRLSHRSMQILLSLVGGVMAGVAVLDVLPHAVDALSVAADSAGTHDHSHAHAHEGDPLRIALWWALGGFMAMYLLERFVCFHHHDSTGGTCGHAGHDHRLSWAGAVTGLSVHAVLAGAGLAAAIAIEPASAWPGLGLLLAIAVHKPFDGLAIVMLMNKDGRSTAARWTVNGLYALVTPVGVLAGWWLGDATGIAWTGPVLGLTAGLLLCIALSDVLPELQFHDHDRVALTVALLAGLGIAAVAASLH